MNMIFLDQPEFVLFFDGAGTPTTPGGWGWVLYDDEGSEMQFGYGPMPDGSTSNEAEYTAVKSALLYAFALVDGAREDDRTLPKFTIKGDSQLVINQLLGLWQVREPRLQVLHAEAHAVLVTLRGGWALEWIPRAQNTRADQLSKEGRKQAERLMELELALERAGTA